MLVRTKRSRQRSVRFNTPLWTLSMERTGPALPFCRHWISNSFAPAALILASKPPKTSCKGKPNIIRIRYASVWPPALERSKSRGTSFPFATLSQTSVVSCKHDLKRTLREEAETCGLFIELCNHNLQENQLTFRQDVCAECDFILPPFLLQPVALAAILRINLLNFAF
jgi:hypothetical protein